MSLPLYSTLFEVLLEARLDVATIILSVHCSKNNSVTVQCRFFTDLMRLDIGQEHSNKR